MRVVDDIIKAARTEIRRLMASRSFADSPLDAALAKETMAHVRPLISRQSMAVRIIRIEVDHDVDCDIAAWRYRYGCGDDLTRSDHIGPRTLMGIDVYVVDRLPAPGWRVVNPFRETM